MKAISYLTLAISLFFFLAINAQTGFVQGKIADKQSKENLPYVNITSVFNNKTFGTQSDEFGAFKLELPSGNHKINVSYIGYEDNIVDIEILENQTVTLNFDLIEESSLLETVVISGSKFEKPISQVTVSLEVIKPETLENANDVDLNQTIEKVPGVDVIDGQANIRGGSGFSYGAGSRVLLLMDGLPALTGDAGFPFWNFLPIENVGQIEIIKGAASALYGSSAMNGVINLRTAYAKSKPETKISAFTGFIAKPKDNETGIYKYLNADGDDIVFDNSFANSLLELPEEVKSEIADSLEYQKAWWDNAPTESGITISHKQKFNKLDIVTSGMWFDKTYWRTNDIEKRTRIFAGFRYRPNIKGLSFGINTNFMKNTTNSFLIWDLETDSSSLDFNPVGQYQQWDNTPRITNDAYKITIDPFVEYFTESGLTAKWLGRYFKNNNKNDTNQSTFSDTYYNELQLQKRFEDLDLTLVGGLVATNVKVKAELFGDTIITENGDLPSDTLFTNGEFYSNNYAAYIQADKKIVENLNASVGIRFESNDILGVKESKPVFRAGLNYQLAEYTFLRSSFGQAYRFPTIAEKFIQTNLGAISVPGAPINLDIGIFPNVNLNSETGWSAELGIKQGFKISEFKAYIDATAFINEYKNMMEFTFGVSKEVLFLLGVLSPDLWPELDTVVINAPSGLEGVGFQSINIGNTRIAGTDFSIGGTGKIFGLETNILTGYTFIKPTFKNFGSVENILSSSDNNILKYRFQHTFKLDGDINYKFITLGQSMRYYSFMEAIDEAFNKFLPGVQSFREIHNGGTFVWDGRVQFHLQERKHTVSLICKNMLNTEYALRPAIINAPRTYTLKYTLKL